MRKKCCGVINGGVAVRAGWPLSGREKERERKRKREEKRGKEAEREGERKVLMEGGGYGW